MVLTILASYQRETKLGDPLMRSKFRAYHLLFLMFIVAMLPRLVLAADDADLPPRPIPPSKPESAPETVRTADGAKIILRTVLSEDVGLETWTQVQWLDDNGRWRDVPGWRGTFYFNDDVDQWEVEWWIGGAQLGDGPFRWVVEAEAGSFYTQAFYLPARSKVSEIIEIGLETSDHR